MFNNRERHLEQDLQQRAAMVVALPLRRGHPNQPHSANPKYSGNNWICNPTQLCSVHKSKKC